MVPAESPVDSPTLEVEPGSSVEATPAFECGTATDTGDTGRRMHVRLEHTDAGWSAQTLGSDADKKAESREALWAEVARQQARFLQHGPREHRPLTQQDIADVIGLDASTVSRLLSGTVSFGEHNIPAEEFFAPQVAGRSATACKVMILDAVAAKPDASDKSISQMLAKHGVPCARRTVAKYREQLGILPSHLRKSFTG